MDTIGIAAAAGNTALDRVHGFGRVRRCVAGFGALGTAVLVAVAVLKVAGHPVTAFMWGRSLGLLAGAAVMYWLVTVAERGARWAYVRMRILAFLMPVAVIAVDVIPGTLPVWFVLAQAVCACALLPAALVLNGAGLRAAFPKGR
ncbi:hypothetical protein [Streptomyces sp. NPDC051561]|uniref:hypothetical protein n=1 Tax=Streptomyces sp. NPDC051561 TaxID=3365658 RepID=UPI0037BA3D22